MSIGQKIRILREERGLSQQELAQYLNVKQQTIDAWERSVTNPRKNNIDRLASFFLVQAGYFFENDDNSKIGCISKGTTQLSEHECKLIEKYRELSETAKIRVEARIDAEYDMMKEAEAEKAKDA